MEISTLNTAAVSAVAEMDPSAVVGKKNEMGTCSHRKNQRREFDYGLRKIDSGDFE